MDAISTPRTPLAAWMRPGFARIGQTLIALIALCIVGAATPAQAAGLSVAPISVQFAPNEAVQGLWLSNSDNRALRAQIRVFAWTQDNGEDRLEPSTALVVSPPMLSVAAGQRQFVRLVRPGGRDAPREQSYRLLIDELPEAGAARPGLSFVMRYSVPVFIGTPAGAVAPPQWSLTPATDGAPRLQAHNHAARRLQLSELEIVGAQDQVLYRQAGLLGYVLAGSHRQWPLPLPATAVNQAREIRVRIDGERVVQAWPAPAVVGTAR